MKVSYSVRILETNVLRMTFGPQRDEITAGKYNVELATIVEISIL